MSKMKKVFLFAKLLAVLAMSVQLTACLGDDDPYSAGFQFTKPSSVRTPIYANTTTDTLEMLCLGPWQITNDTPEATWCTLDETKGRGNTIYAFGVHFEQNTTGKARLVQFTIVDTAHPSDAHASWQYLQYATRGDGSLGTAPLVKGIKSSDGWDITVGYDEKDRPIQMTVKGPDVATQRYTMDYNEQTSKLSVNTGSSTMTGTMDNGYQTERLVGGGDTLGYVSQYYSNGMQMPMAYAFNYVASSIRRTQAFAYLFGGKSLSPDSLHTADSLIYLNRWKLEERPQTIERYKLEYSQTDNRCQTVDANQLVFGMDHCEPLQLLSMFRYCRSTSIISRATAVDGTIDVTTELNADRSVRSMVVRDSRKNTEVTYKFEY